MPRCAARAARPCRCTVHRCRECHEMTAPLKHSDTTIVDVALGARIAALRPGVRTAIVTDKTVARHWLEATEASLAAAGIASSRIIVDEGEGSKSYATLERVSEALIAAKI